MSETFLEYNPVAFILMTGLVAFVGLCSYLLKKCFKTKNSLLLSHVLSCALLSGFSYVISEKSMPAIIIFFACVHVVMFLFALGQIHEEKAEAKEREQKYHETAVTYLNQKRIISQRPDLIKKANETKPEK